MYSHFRGELISLSPSQVVIEIGGIGYQIFIPANAFPKLPQTGSTLLIYTSFIVRESSQTLYGFLSSQERDLFEILLTVSGIGPKLALNLIGHIAMQDLQFAICNHDIASLSKVPGIGKKTAERLILELRDKLPSLMPTFSDLAISVTQDPQSQLIIDAMSALIHLGYNQLTAQKAIKKSLKELPDGSDLPALITHSLKNI